MLLDKIKYFFQSKLMEKAILFSVTFFLYKLFFPYQETFLTTFITEFLVVNSLYFWLAFLPDKLTVKRTTILTLFSTLLLIGFVFLITEAIIISLLPEKEFFKLGFFYNSLVTVLSIVLAGLSVYIFSIFKKLFFLKQKYSPTSYFKVMVTFASLVGFLYSFSPYLKQFFGFKDYIEENYFSVIIFIEWLTDIESILQIGLIIILIFNSFRVAWLASLNKSEKQKIILFSLILVAINGNALYFLFENSTITKLAYLFSPFLYISITSIILYAAIYSLVIFFTTLFHLPTAEESDRKTEELSTLLNFGKLMTHILDLRELLESIMTMSLRLSNFNAAWFYYPNNFEQKILTTNIQNSKLEQISNKLLEKVDVKTSRQTILSKYQNIYHELNSEYASTIIVKFEFDKESAYLFLLQEKYSDVEEEVFNSIQGFRDYAIVALKNAILVVNSIEKERMEKELELAREIQERINPQILPKFQQFDVSAKFIPAFEVGGDYYDFFTIGNKTGFVIADVSGKGMEASYIMAEMKGVFETLSTIYTDLKDLLIQANRIFLKRLSKKSFITAIVGIIDDKESKINYFRIGHNLPLKIDEESKYLESKGFPFGMVNNEIFTENLEEVEVIFSKETMMIFYTDGISESMNENDELFGYERLQKLGINLANENAETISQVILTEVGLYSKSTIQDDDITILIFKKST